MKVIIAIAVVVLAFVLIRRSQAQEAQGPLSATDKTVYDFKVQTITGEEKSLSDYKGKVLLIVNTASRCGFTPQYKGLEGLYETYKDKGFEILAFPANDFLGQEPGSNEEIKTFCTLKYKTTFPLFAKISVRGPNTAPLYNYLTTQTAFSGGITWNFNKFLVGRDGKVVARFDSKVTPQSDEIVNKIKQLL